MIEMMMMMGHIVKEQNLNNNVNILLTHSGPSVYIVSVCSRRELAQRTIPVDAALGLPVNQICHERTVINIDSFNLNSCCLRARNVALGQLDHSECLSWLTCGAGNDTRSRVSAAPA